MTGSEVCLINQDFGKELSGEILILSEAMSLPGRAQATTEKMLMRARIVGFKFMDDAA